MSHHIFTCTCYFVILNDHLNKDQTVCQLGTLLLKAIVISY